MVDFRNTICNNVVAEGDMFARERIRFLHQFIESQMQRRPQQELIPLWEEEPKMKKMKRAAPPTAVKPVVSTSTSQSDLSDSVPLSHPKRRGRPPKAIKKVIEEPELSESDKEKERRVAKWRGEFVPKESSRAKALRKQALDSKLAAQKALPNICVEIKKQTPILGDNTPDPCKSEKIQLARASIEEEKKRYKKIQDAKLRKIRLGAKKRTEEKAFRKHAQNPQKVSTQPLKPPPVIPVESKKIGYQIPKLKK